MLFTCVCVSTPRQPNRPFRHVFLSNLSINGARTSTSLANTANCMFDALTLQWSALVYIFCAKASPTSYLPTGQGNTRHFTCRCFLKRARPHTVLYAASFIVTYRKDPASAAHRVRLANATNVLGCDARCVLQSFGTSTTQTRRLPILCAAYSFGTKLPTCAR